MIYPRKTKTGILDNSNDCHELHHHQHMHMEMLLSSVIFEAILVVHIQGKISNCAPVFKLIYSLLVPDNPETDYQTRARIITTISINYIMLQIHFHGHMDKYAVH